MGRKCVEARGREKKGLQKGARKLLEATDLFIILIAAIFSLVYIYHNLPNFAL